MPTQLEQAVAYIKAGDIEKGKQLLAEVIRQNPRDETAWLWMTRCVGSAAEKRYCFDQVLNINPQNQHAIKGLERLNNPVSPITQPKAKVVQQQPVKKKGLSTTGTIAVIGLGVTLFCVCGFFIVGLFLNSSSGTTAKVLSAEDSFEVSAIDVVAQEGYTVTSAVCEVVSSERYTVQGYDFGKIVFHAFRITKPTLGTEAVVLFQSNHTAQDGSGLVHTVNPLAKTLFSDFPDAAVLKHPITTDTPGAQDALDCAQRAGSPPALDFGNFDHEAWRREAIKKWGEEQTYPDGSKQDHVRLALGICKYVKENPSMRYEEGSQQQWIIETFCTYVK